MIHSMSFFVRIDCCLIQLDGWQRVQVVQFHLECGPSMMMARVIFVELPQFLE